MDYGYVRISTPKQNIERQVRNILRFSPDAQIVQEVYTGTTQDRPKWNWLRGKVKPEDRIIFDEVSRMARDAAEGMTIYEQLYNADINLIFLKEEHCNTEKYREALQRQINIFISTGDSATDEFMAAIIAALNKFLMDLAKKDIELAFLQAEKEVQYLRQRTKEGLNTARLNGKQIGQTKGVHLITKKSIKAKQDILKYNKTFGGMLTNEETWRLAGITKTSFYKYKAELLADQEQGKAAL